MTLPVSGTFIKWEELNVPKTGRVIGAKITEKENDGKTLINVLLKIKDEMSEL